VGTLVHLEVKAKPERVHDVIGLLKQLLPETRAYDGCQEVAVYLNEDGRTFVYFEMWDSKSHYERYLAWREETGVLAELVALIEDPPNIRYFEPVDA
jgi:quinol monooxygenase YgiN